MATTTPAGSPAPSRSRRLLWVGLALVGLAYLGASLRRVPETLLTVRDSRLPGAPPTRLAPGWHLVPWGFFHTASYPAGEVGVPFGVPEPVALTTPEGSAVAAAGEVRYRIRPDRVATFHAQSGGRPQAWLEERVHSVLARLITDGGFAPLTRTQVPALEAAGLRALSLAGEPAGLTIAGITFRTLEYAGAPLVTAGPRPLPGRKVLWLAVDSLDWDIIEPLIAAGRMPHLARLMEEGAWGNLQSIAPILSPVIWTTVATGKLPEKHGIVDFVATDPRTGATLPVTSTLRRTRAFWNILSDRGLSVGVIAWWASFPAEPVEGFLCTDRIAYQLFKEKIKETAADDPFKTYPGSLYREIAPLIRPPARVPDRELARFIDLERYGARFSRDDRSRVNEFRTVLASAHTYTDIAFKLFAERPTDLRVLYLEGPDTASHLFMPFTAPPGPGIPPEKVDWFGQVVPEIYAYHDELIGRFLERFADETTTVIVCSDHGFKVGEERPEEDSRIGGGAAAAWHTKEGMLVLSGPDIRRGQRILGASVLDLVPTLLALFGLPVGEDMDGKVLTAAFTEAFAAAHPIQTLPTHDTGEDRPRAGPTGTSASEQALLEKLIALGYVQQDAPTARLNQGMIAFQAGDYATAIAELQAALEQMDKPQTRLNLAQAYRLHGQLAEAEETLRRLLTVGWNRAWVLTELAAVARDREDWRGAESLLEEALAADPEYAEAQVHFARLYERQERWEEAIAAYRRACALDPDLYQAWNQLGVLLHRGGRLPEAIQALERAIQINPDMPAPYNNLGLIYQEREEPDRARAVLEQGTLMAPKAAILHNSLGSLHYNAGALEKAAAAFERAVELDPEYAEPVSNLATVYRELKDAKKTTRYLLRLIQLEPDNAEAQFALGLMFLTQRRPGDAEMALTEVLRIDPRHLKALVTLGRIHLGQQQPAAAVRRLEQAVALESQVHQIWNELARAYAAAGRPAAARTAYRRSLALNPDQPRVTRALADLAE